MSFESKLERIFKEAKTLKTPSCMSTETLGLFVEKKLSSKERLNVEEHVTSCLHCLNELVELRELIHLQKKRESIPDSLIKKLNVLFPDEKAPFFRSIQTRISSFVRESIYLFTLPFRQWRFAMVSAVSAAAVILALIYFYGREDAGKFIPPSSGEIVERLAKNTDLKLISDSIKESQVTTYGFSGEVSLQKVSFRIGVFLTDLEVSLRAEDKAKSIAINKNLISTIQSIEGPGDIISSYVDISKKIEEGVSPKQFSGKIQMIESFLKDKNTFLYLRFGEWVEGGRLAVSARNKAFFDIKSNKYFIKNLKGKVVPQGVLKTLEGMKVVFERKEFTDKDFKHLEKAFTDIMEMM
jgi:hypothetical protein